MIDATEGATPHSVLRVLALDGGGAKGFYTLGVLKEIEAMVGCPLHQILEWKTLSLAVSGAAAPRTAGSACGP